MSNFFRLAVRVILLLGVPNTSACGNFHLDEQFIVWNVGQGQWTSEVHNNFCLHFDLGGERNVSYEVLRFCRNKMNYLHLSHWDWDHISYAAKFAALTPQVCLFRRPTGPSSTEKMNLIEQIPLCNTEQLHEVAEWTLALHTPSKAKKGDSNSLSEVMYSKAFKIVIPGDSPKTQEKFWAEKAPARSLGLVLGHHGSRTSTSLQLLEQMSHLQWAVSTARKKRYGHPHTEVVALLKKEKVPLLRTEDWGHLHFLF